MRLVFYLKKGWAIYSMKNENIIAAWDSIIPDKTADERMLSSILGYNRSFKNENKTLRMTRGMKGSISAAACLVLVIAVAAFAGTRQGRFSESGYKVVLGNGDSMVYEKGYREAIRQDYDYGFEVRTRALTDAELGTIFHGIGDTAESFGTFSAETGELVRVTSEIGAADVAIARTGLPASDVIIEGNEVGSVVNGIPVRSGYFVTKVNSYGIKTIIFFAEYTHGDVTVYAELAGDEKDAADIGEQLSEIIYSLTLNGAPDLSAVTF